MCRPKGSCPTVLHGSDDDWQGTRNQEPTEITLAHLYRLVSPFRRSYSVGAQDQAIAKHLTRA